MEKKPSLVVAGLIINQEGKVLLCRSRKWNNLWIVPGGHIEYGESIEDAIKREIKEEVGLDIELKKVLFVQELIEPKDYIKKKHLISLECVCSTKDNNVEIDDDEIQDHKWIEPEDALKEKTDPYTHEFIKKYLEEM
ncbi:MAG: NUDIX domain-containing protein [Candidatus Aenigmarchaeota archaeon]|nr:NUDIX domain-containing protein [Candidatus Aenigmarchaeota archaeon]